MKFNIVFKVIYGESANILEEDCDLWKTNIFNYIVVIQKEDFW